jgi:ketosteroid isomerase-like protein
VASVSDRTDRLQQAFAALNGGDSGAFRNLFAEDAQWLGVPGSGVDGSTPI